MKASHLIYAFYGIVWIGIIVSVITLAAVYLTLPTVLVAALIWQLPVIAIIWAVVGFALYRYRSIGGNRESELSGVLAAVGIALVILAVLVLAASYVQVFFPTAFVSVPAAFVSGLSAAWAFLTTTAAGPIILGIGSVACLVTMGLAAYFINKQAKSDDGLPNRIPQTTINEVKGGGLSTDEHLNLSLYNHGGQNFSHNNIQQSSNL